MSLPLRVVMVEDVARTVWLALQIGHRVSILARALAYFDDAEQQPMPELTRRIKWAEVKRYAEAGAPYIVEQQRAQARRAGL